jgi:hypothetical protein
MEDGMAQASTALLAAMKSRHEAILDWQNEPETAGAPSGADMVFCSPVARAVVSRLNMKWSTHSICEQQRTVEEVWTTQDARGIGYTYERAQRMARDSLADVTAYRADLLREWLEKHTPGPFSSGPTTYLDILRFALKSMRDVKELFHPTCEVSLDGDKLHIVIEANEALVARFAVENKRVFKGPLFCHTCGLPAVPFGGEDICLDPHHDHVDHDNDDDRVAHVDDDHDISF